MAAQFADSWGGVIVQGDHAIPLYPDLHETATDRNAVITVFNEAVVVEQRHPELPPESKEALVRHRIQTILDTYMKAMGIFAQRPLYTAILQNIQNNGNGVQEIPANLLLNLVPDPVVDPEMFLEGIDDNMGLPAPAPEVIDLTSAAESVFGGRQESN